MEFERVIKGITKYLNNEIYSGMNDWQEMLARIAVSRMIGNTNNLKNALINNPFVRTFAIIDENGDVDIEGLLEDIKLQLAEKGKITFSLPLFGNFTFTPTDIEKLHREIMEA